MSTTAKRRPVAVLLFLASVAAAALVVVPQVLSMPFRPQTPASLEWVYRLKVIAPWATVALFVVAVWAIFRLWSSRPRKSRARAVALALVLALCLAPIVGATYISRQNIFEQYFAPLPETRYTSAADAALDDAALVIGVEVDGQALAYPVSIVGYHHIVNDRLTSEPFVVTY